MATSWQTWINRIPCERPLVMPPGTFWRVSFRCVPPGVSEGARRLSERGILSSLLDSRWPRKKAEPLAARPEVHVGSTFQCVNTLSVTSERAHAQAPLLSQMSANESPDTVSLPAGRSHDLFQGGSARLFQQVHNFGRLAPLAGASGLLAGLGPLPCRGGLVSRLRLGARNAGHPRPCSGLFRRFQLFCGSRGVVCWLAFRNGCGHFAFSFGGDNRGHDIHRSCRAHKQILPKFEEGKGIAMKAGMRKQNLSKPGNRSGGRSRPTTVSRAKSASVRPDLDQRYSRVRMPTRPTPVLHPNPLHEPEPLATRHSRVI